jgi:hypothetical protein
MTCVVSSVCRVCVVCVSCVCVCVRVVCVCVVCICVVYVSCMCCVCRVCVAGEIMLLVSSRAGELVLRPVRDIRTNKKKTKNTNRGDHRGGS